MLGAARRRGAVPIDLLEHSGHYPFIDDPPAVTEVVVAFLRRQLAAAPPGRDPGHDEQRVSKPLLREFGSEQ